MSTNPKFPNVAPSDDVHLIVAEDEEVIIEHHPEDWIAFALFWALAFIVFLQFFTRYILNDSFGLDRGDRALRVDVAGLHRRRGGNAQENPYRRRIAGQSDEARPAANLAVRAGRFRDALFHGIAGLFLDLDPRAHAGPDHDGVRSADEPCLRRRRLRLLPDADPTGRDGLDPRAPALAEG